MTQRPRRRLLSNSLSVKILFIYSHRGYAFVQGSTPSQSVPIGPLPNLGSGIPFSAACQAGGNVFARVLIIGFHLEFQNARIARAAAGQLEALTFQLEGPNPLRLALPGPGLNNESRARLAPQGQSP